MMSSYSPVAYEYREFVEEMITKRSEGKVFFFDGNGRVDSTQGKVVAIREVPSEGMFLFMDSNASIRIDRIITLFGNPGAAYDAYDAYANACLACTGGYDL
jgi:hypothetical protein